jgi:NAD(P)-dependent dehydrogenase (short-subunit alcohol dehydrogenase family)
MPNPSYDFSGHVAIVTGAVSGVGLATVEAFVEAGAAVTIADVNADAVAQLEKRLRDEGHQVLGVVCDVSDEQQVASMVEKTVSTFGRLDAAFNNAGIIGAPSELPDEPAEVYDRTNDVNARGIWACMKYELRHMRTAGSGAIVNCSSQSGLIGQPGRSSYNAAKHAIVGLTKSAGVEFASRGIRVNAVCPGTIDTPMVSSMVERGELTLEQAIAGQPIGRIGKPEEVAAAVLWLCSPGASMVTGVALPVDGGYVAQ